MHSGSAQRKIIHIYLCMFIKSFDSIGEFFSIYNTEFSQQKHATNIIGLN